MKKILFFLSIFLIQIWIQAQNNVDSSPDSLVDNSYFEPVSDTLSNINIFETDELLNITLQFDITSFIKNKLKGKYQNATFQIHYGNNQLISKTIRLKARGEFRRDKCFLPPIRLNFKTDPLEKEGLVEKVKLVTHCSNVKKYENFILKEYLIYKLYNVLTDNSFRVRLLNISYIDTGEKRKNYQNYGFIIEPIELLAVRNEATVINPDIIRKESVIEEDADLVALFQYMIGHTDWRIEGGHNLKYIKSINLNPNKVIPVPYDFDFSGFVGASYSYPQVWTSIKTVQEREYLGYCRNNDEAYLGNINLFNDKKDEIFEIIEEFEYLSEREKTKALKYIEEFYSQINNPERFVYTLKNECRTEF
ncbi:MAG: hypothetical protein HQ541_18295 [Mariniphaga sp.]|nr:hypothetical protein [Mariniphaga sp.]